MSKKRGSLRLENNVLQDIIDSRLKQLSITIEKTRYLIAISGIILTIAATEFASDNFLAKSFFIRIGIAVIFCSAIFCILISIKSDENKGKNVGLFSIQNKQKKANEKDYEMFIRRIISSEKNIIKEYAKEILQLDENIRRKMNNIAIVAYVLSYGLIIGGFLVVLGLI